MTIRKGPSGILVTLDPADVTPGTPGQELATDPAGNVVWASPQPAVPPWTSVEDGNLVVAPGTLLLEEGWFGTVSFAAGGTLDLNGFALHCRTLDLRNTVAGAIRCIGTAGAAGAAGLGGAGGLSHQVAANYTMLQGGTPGGQGGDAGFDGTGGGGITFGPWGGITGNGGNGGAGGDSATQIGAPVTVMQRQRMPYLVSQFRGPAIFAVGVPNLGGASGGGGGGGSATVGGGGGGGGAGVCAIFARNIIVDATTPAGAIDLTGQPAGAGETTAAALANGGGGGAGGGGGWLYLAYWTITGTLAGVAILSGGAGAVGGDGGAGGAGGDGGDGGSAGRVTRVDLANGTVTDVAGPVGVAGTAAVGAVGGAGGAGGLLVVNF